MRCDTIYSLSSGSDRAGVAVIRISGPAADHVLLTMGCASLPAPRMATRVLLKHPVRGDALDDALAIRFPAPKSFTGETVIELHVHGGRAVVRSVLEALASRPGLRPAEAGEFTRRAFAHGKIDLTGAEALADLIDAETDRQRAQALGQLGGRLSHRSDAWREGVLQALALIEAAIDFSDEGDVAQDALAQAVRVADATAQDMAAALDDGHRGEIIRSGFHVAILGPPNAGKSSLLNVLAGRDAAIVSDEPGTTRDVIDVVIDLAGVPVRFSDTAGLRADAGTVEREGIKRAMARAKDSHLILLISSPDVLFRAEEYPELDLAQRVREGSAMVVENKSDLAEPGDSNSQTVRISCRTGAGIEPFLADLSARITHRLEVGAGSHPLITQARHRAQIVQAQQALTNFSLAAATKDFPLELAAEDLRAAGNALGRITGKIDVEDVLGAIFGRFCIGK